MADTIIPVINDFATTDQAGLDPNFVGIQVNPAEGVKNIPIIYGTRKIEGIRLWTYVPTSNTRLLYCVYALSEGYCRGLQKLFIDDVAIEIDYTQVAHRTPIQIGTGTYGGILEFEFIDGRGLAQYGTAGTTNVGPSSLIQRDLLIAKQYPNLCYLVCKFSYITPTPYRNIPKVSAIVNGRRIVNLNQGNLGGTFTTNPVDILWDLLYNATYGAGVGYDKMDYASFLSAKNSCNTLLASRGGTNIPQFECNWICDTGKNLLDNIQYLLDSYKMTLSFLQGKYSVSLESNPSDSDTPTGGLTFNSDNIISEISVQYPNLTNKFNKVIVDYPDRDNNYQSRSQVWPVSSTNTYLDEDGGVLLEQRFSADTITSFWGASDMAQMILLRSRTQKVYRFTADKTAHRIRVGDYIFINLSVPLISNQKVLVVSMEMNDDYTFNLECVSYLPTNYPAAFTNTPSPPASSNQQPPGGGGIVPPAPLPNPNPPPVPPAPAVSYTLSANGSTFNEGSTITFTLTTTNVANGTVVRWAWASGGPTASDISPSALNGTATINNNTWSYTVAALSDGASEGSESWEFRIGDYATGAILATSTVVIQDVSAAPPPTQFAYTFAGAAYIDTINTNNQRVANTNWYMAFTNSLNGYDATETQNNGNQVTWSGGPPSIVTAYVNNCVRQRIVKTVLNASTGQAYATVDIDVCLIDRLTVNQTQQRQIFCVYDDFTQYLASTGGWLNQVYKALNQEISTFNPDSPPTGTNLLRTTRRSHQLFGSTSLAGWERIDNTSTSSPQANDIPGIVRLLPVTGKPGHYATNLAQTSGRNTIKTVINVGSNSNPIGSGVTATNGRNCFLNPIALDSTNVSTNRLLKLTFFEVIPATSLVVPLGYKIVACGLNRGCITAKYYDESRANLTATIGTFANPMPA